MNIYLYTKLIDAFILNKIKKIICNANEKHVALALEGLCIKNKVKYFILTDFFEKQLTSYPDEEKPLNSTNSNSRLTINTTGIINFRLFLLKFYVIKKTNARKLS